MLLEDLTYFSKFQDIRIKIQNPVFSNGTAHSVMGAKK